MRYLNRLRLKQESLVIKRKETGKSLYDFFNPSETIIIIIRQLNAIVHVHECDLQSTQGIILYYI